MLRDTSETDLAVIEEDRCDPDCGCAAGNCAAHNFLPPYQPNDFQRNVTAMSHALENFSFAIGVVARLVEEAHLLTQDEAL